MVAINAPFLPRTSWRSVRASHSWLLAAVVVLLVGSSSVAADPLRPLVVPLETEGAAGTLAVPTGARVVFGEPVTGTGERPTAWITQRDGGLDVEIRIPVEPGRRLLARVQPRASSDAPALLDDAVEVWLADGVSSSASRLERIVAGAAGAAGAVWAGVYSRNGDHWKLAHGRSAGAAVTSSIRGSRWNVRVRLPLPAGVAQSTGRELGLRIAYRARRGGRSAAWPGPAALGHTADGLAAIQLGHSALVLQEVDAPLPSAIPPSSCDRLTPAGAQGAVLQVAFYPTYGKLRAYLDVTRVPWADAIRTVELRLRRQGEGTAVLEAPLPLGTAGPQAADALLSLPHLESGVYDVDVSFAVPGCAPIAGPHRSIEQRVFGWEGNHLGESDEVLPPFTPLAVSGHHVAAVGRDHVMNDVGVFDQIESEGQPLLQAPARFDLRVAGHDATPTPLRPVTITRRTPASVTFSAEWKAGTLRAKVEGRVEIDGLVRADLAISGDPALELDRLDLVLPFRPEQAALLNAITDGTLHHFLGALPAGTGTGTVWDSTKVGRVDLPPEFVPYIWLGSEERGLSWMAESTRDWLIAPGVPTQEIRRRGSSVDLVIHFVTKPGPLRRSRKLSFALQATPAKPRPEKPRPWRTWQLACSAPSAAFRVCPLASAFYWGSETRYGHVYPRDHDESVFGLIAAARRSGHADLQGVDGWLARHRIPEADLGSARDSVRWSLSSAAYRPDAIVAYLSAHTAAWTPEFSIYTDEWRPAPFEDRAGRDASWAGDIVTVPARSWQDFVLFYLDRMLASGAVDGFFLDNTFLRVSYDADFGPAYRDDDGIVHPGVDLFSLREFMKRLETLVWQRRGMWMDVGHMTTTPIAAVQVWSAMSLDGEWKYGRSDYQDRFPRDLLRAGGIGAQAGTVPVFLPGLVGETSTAERARLERSLAGTTGVHEIRVMTTLVGPVGTVWKTLYDFGYGRPGCDVRRYWDSKPGFTLRGPDSEALMVACEGRALALVVSFGDGGDVDLALDLPTLGLAPRGRCLDAEGARPPPVALDAGCRFRLDRHDMRLIVYEGGGR